MSFKLPRNLCAEMRSRHINEVFVICSALKRSEAGPSGPDHRLVCWDL